MKLMVAYGDASSQMNCVLDSKRTCEYVEQSSKYHNTWISQPGSYLAKRQCSLQGHQPLLAIIFRGGGKRITNDEKLAYHPDVVIYFSKKMPGCILAFVWNGGKNPNLVLFSRKALKTCSSR